MELQTILSIAIPVVGLLAFLSGYFFGKSDGIKLCRTDQYASNDEIYQIGFHEGKKATADYLKNWAKVYLKELQNKPQRGNDNKELPEPTCKE